MAMDDVISVIKGEAVHEVSATCVTQVGLVESMGARGAAWPEAQADPAKMARLGASLFDLAGLSWRLGTNTINSSFSLCLPFLCYKKSPRP
jgi:uroporphyrinogen-III decarboxylase